MGILLSLGSATFMVTYGQDLGGAGAVRSLVGNALLLLTLTLPYP